MDWSRNVSVLKEDEWENEWVRECISFMGRQYKY